MEGSREIQGSTNTATAVDPHTAAGRPGPTWRAWVVTIVLAVVLSVAATLTLGGFAAFRSGGAPASQAAESGCGGSCCPPADAGK